LFSIFSKNKQDSASQDSGFYSRAEEESKAIRNPGGAGKRGAGKRGSEAVDPVLPEKKRARRRLVGAVALVLAVIIGLPMVLDSEPKPLAGDIAIQIPSKDKPYQGGAIAPHSAVAAKASSRVSASEALDQREEIVDAPVAAAAPAQPAAPAPSAPSAPSVKPSVPVKPSATAALTVDEALPVLKKPKDSAKPATSQSSEHKADTKPEPKPEAKPVIKTVEVKSELKREPKPESKPESKPVVLAKPDSRPAPKSELAQQDSAAADGADEAGRAKAILEGKSDKADVKSDHPKAASEQKGGKFIVQVAALATQEKINELQGKLKEAGIKSYTQKVATESGDRTRIRVGPFSDKEEAAKMRAKLIKLGLNGTLVPQ
jgi:DedD protein